MKAEIVNMVVRIFEVILGLADLKRKLLQNQRGLERGGKEGTDFGDLKLQFLFKQTTRALKLLSSLPYVVLVVELVALELGDLGEHSIKIKRALGLLTKIGLLG